jgi:Sec-independent protein translocase protein TatA
MPDFPRKGRPESEMALDPLELGSIAAIILVFFLWGPQKIPELARMVAQARREFDNASREFQKVSAGIQNGTSPFLQPSSPAQTPAPAAALQPSQPGTNAALSETAIPASSPKTGDQLLIEAARRLGIPTGGKTREQIQQEIIAMAQRPPSSGDSLPPPKDDSPP